MSKHRNSSDRVNPATIDRGPARYFHGREKILSDFKFLTDRVHQKKIGGTTFLIQGAPGAGKSALLYECEKIADAKGWKIAQIDGDALWEPNALRYSIGLSNIFRSLNITLRIALNQFFSAEIRVERSQRTMKKILESGKKPLLLIIDEAQTLGTTSKPSKEFESTATHILKAIHNGDLKKPVVLLAAGLGQTMEFLGLLGISRFAENCFVKLGPLSNQAERAVIKDWLVREGGAKGDITEWIDAIQQETHGWARHVQSYAFHAAYHLNENGGRMTQTGLSTVLELGREGRKMYYKQRLVQFNGDEIQCLVNCMPDNPLEPPTSRQAILSSMTQQFEEHGNQLIEDFINKGILVEKGKGLTISIPSMHAWLKEEYGT
ncbi:MAG: ATP-binding protein [Bacteroidetes bacterium]|nr:ATP-binding protein [Bacteroidota bacterium]